MWQPSQRKIYSIGVRFGGAGGSGGAVRSSLVEVPVRCRRHVHRQGEIPLRSKPSAVLRGGAALALAMALLLGACSSDDDAGGGTDTSSAPSGPVNRSPVTVKVAGMGITAQFPG